MSPNAKSRRWLSVSAVALAAPALVLYLGSYFWALPILVLAAVLAAAAAAPGREERRAAAARALRRAAVPSIGIVAALVLGAAVMLAGGFDPVASYGALFYGGLVKNWHISVLNATPLIFTALAIAFAFKGGLFNIGAEGQYYAGVMAATWLGLRLALPAPLAVPFIFLAGAVCGAALNAIPAVLKVKTGAHEVVTTMMLAYAVRTLSPMFIRANGGDPSATTHPYVTDTIRDAFKLPLFKDFLPNANYRLHIGILIAIATAFLVRFVLDRTNLGYKIRAVGFNPVAARTEGISVGRVTAAALLISGGLAAMAGVTQVLGLDYRMYQNLNAGYGWNGISVALLARNDPIVIVFAALLWGVLDSGGQYMARTVQTPNAIIEIVKGMILFLLLAETIYQRAGKAILERRRRRGAARGGERMAAAVEREEARS